VKYWGKRDAQLNLPANGSISVTMDEQLKTETTVEFSSKYKQDEVTLGERKLEGSERHRVVEQLDILRHKAGNKEYARIVTENAFPSAAGMASSASGYAALTLAASHALGLKMGVRELSVISRRGSGSACRSLFGGFVEWHRGERDDGSDSLAEPLSPAAHWKSLRNVIAIVKKDPKRILTRPGMNRTVLTSTLYQRRLQSISIILQRVRKALEEKNRAELFELVMRDSNSMHACMLDSYPPLFYMNEHSHKVIETVHALNDAYGEAVAGYTFDAGPNAHVFTEDKRVSTIRKMLSEISGVENVMVCKVGNGPVELKQHLF